jgi:hypothetical protein
MKQWLKNLLGPKDLIEHRGLSATDDYVIARVGEINKDARELDMMVAHLQDENKRLRGEIRILTEALRDATGTHQDLHKP